jgi:hypothetical protein
MPGPTGVPACVLERGPCDPDRRNPLFFNGLLGGHDAGVAFPVSSRFEYLRKRPGARGN